MPAFPSLPFLHVTIPVLDEGELFGFTLQCLENQSYSDYRVVICINQPDDWWNDPGRRAVCERNVSHLEMLSRGLPFDNILIDRCSRGRGWKGKRSGVGWARKTLMDKVMDDAGQGDLIISLDADTVFGEDYLLSVALSFIQNPFAAAMAVPYYHHLTGDSTLDRAMLRYEIYMRYYLLNLIRIGSPYAFTALGSAIAVPVASYRAVGGITPKQSGEDFYFLQKLKKYGQVLTWNDEKVFPRTRYSDRVGFGTGPALIKGARGDWESYPLYPVKFFDDIWEAYESFPALYHGHRHSRVTRFVSQIFRESDPWQPLRGNATGIEQFVRSCHEKFDGLRVLQYLKTMHGKSVPDNDETNLWEFLDMAFPPEDVRNLPVDRMSFSFAGSSIDDLDAIRTFLSGKEDEYRFIAALL